jgi:hypothetical protein
MATELFREWRVADRTALAAERAVMATAMAYYDGTSAPPTLEAIAEAKRLRGIADDLFSVSMVELAAASARNRRYTP